MRKFLVMLILLSLFSFSHAWWNDSWQYRRQVNITSQFNLTDYQVMIKLTPDIFSFSKARSDLGDVRFTYYNSSSGEEVKIDYWFEGNQSLNYSSGNFNATFWVKVPFLTNVSDNILYVYYGNPSASSESNGSAVFLFFDDFDDWSGWTNSTSPGVVNVTEEGDEMLEKVDNCDPAGGYKDMGVSVINYRFIVKEKRPSSGSDCSWDRYGIENGSWDGYGFRRNAYATGSSQFGFERRDGGSSANANDAYADQYYNRWYITQLTRYEGNFTSSLFDENHTLLGSLNVTDTTYSGPFNYFVIRGGRPYYVMWVAVANYTVGVSDPSIGEEEVATGFNLSFDMPAQNSILFRYTPFTANGTAYCFQGDCGNVSIYLQYLTTVSPTKYWTKDDAGDFLVYNESYNVSISNFLQLSQQGSDIPWWNQSWKYRQSFNISNTYDNLTDYQVVFHLNSSCVGPNFNWSNSGIRFVFWNRSSHQNVELNYFIEYWNASYQNATVWVKIPFLQNDTNTTIYMYYGNPNAVNQSDPEKVFTYWDDFEDGDDSDWVQYGSGQVYVASDPEGESSYSLEKDANCDPNGGYVLLGKSYSFSEGWVLEGRVDRTFLSGCNWDRFSLENGGWNGYGPRLEHNNNILRIERRDSASGTQIGTATSVTLTQNQWNRFKFYANSSGYYIYLYTPQGSLMGSAHASDNTYSSFDRIVVRGGYRYYLDDLRLRRYVRPSPWWTNGTEEVLNYSTRGYYVSEVFDTGDDNTILGNIYWTSYETPTANLTVEVRSSQDNVTWSDWFQDVSGTDIDAPNGRYLQYRVNFTSAYTNESAVLYSITLEYQVLTQNFTDVGPGESFTADNPYTCVMNQTNKYCYPTWSVTPYNEGNYTLRMFGNSSYGVFNYSETRNVTVMVKTYVSSLNFNRSKVGVGQWVRMSAKLVDDNNNPIPNQRIVFYDETNDTMMGEAYTDASGWAVLDYQIPESFQVGVNHTITANFTGNFTLFLYHSSRTDYLFVSSTPKIGNVRAAPQTVGFGYNVTIEARVTDERGLDKVYVVITEPGGTNWYEMKYVGNDRYQYNYSDTWSTGTFPFKIFANNTDGISSESDYYYFYVTVYSSNFLITNKEEYKLNEYVFINNSNNWWNPSWKFRIPYVIYNPNDENLVNYQVRLTANTHRYTSKGLMNSSCKDLRFSSYSAVYELPVTINSTQDLQDYAVPIELPESVYQKMMYDGRDVRVYTSQKTNPYEEPYSGLPYYLQQLPNGFRLWVKMNLSTGENKIYVYYGNESAIQRANGSEVFYYFDDFSSDTLSNYDQYGETWSINTSLGIVYDDSGTNSQAYLVLKGHNATNVTVITRARSNDDDGVGVLGRFSSTSSYYAGIVKTDTGWTPNHYSYILKDAYDNAISWEDTYANVGEWHVVELRMLGNNLTLYVDGVYKNSTSDSDHQIGQVGLFSSYNSPNAEFDYLIVRNTTSEEPVVSVGEEKVILSQYTELDYWIESGCGEPDTVIWVKVPFVPSNANTTVYMYFGNQEAESKSNGSATFEYFDDFSSDTLSNYDQYGDTWSINTSLGVARDDPSTNAVTFLVLKNYNFDDVAVRTRARSNDDDAVGVTLRFSSTSSYYAGGVKDDTTSWSSDNPYTNFISRNSTDAIAGSYDSVGVGSWHEVELKAVGNSLKLYVDGEERVSVFDSYLSSGRVGLISWYNYPYAEFDYVMVRKASSQEPIVYSGELEGIDSFISNDASYGSNYLEENWAYRKEIIVENPNNYDLHYYQMNFSIDTQALISQGKMNSSCKDVRFALYDNRYGTLTEIPYWIESGCNTSNTNIWVKIPNLPKNSNSTVYMYYGNMEAESKSDVNEVFFLYDDFEGTSLNSSRWDTVCSGTCLINVSNSELVMNSTNYAIVYWKGSAPVDYVVEVRGREGSTSGSDLDMGLFADYAGGTSGYWIVFDTSPGSDGFRIYNGMWGSALTSRVSGIDSLENYTFIVKRYGNKLWAKCLNKDTELSLTDTSYNSKKVALATDPDGSGVNAYFDKIVVRAYASQEPNYYLGEEQNTSIPLRVIDFKGYLQLYVQRYVNGNWQDMVPYVVNDLGGSPREVKGGELLDLEDIWEENPWYTDSHPPGRYRVVMRFLDPEGNQLIDNDHNPINATKEFYIKPARLILSNLTHENDYEHNINEYEILDKIDWVNVTAKAVDNTALDANITLQLLDESGLPANWGPSGTKLCGTIPENETCTRRWDNNTNGYPIPEDAGGTYKFYWNVTMDLSNGNATTNHSLYILVHNIRDNLTSSLSPQKIVRGRSSNYTLVIFNPFSKNLTEVNVTINCPEGVNITCNCSLSGQESQDYCYVGDVTAFSQEQVKFVIHTTTDTPIADYHVNSTLEYTNPGEEFKKWEQVQDQVLKVRGNLSLVVYEIVENATRPATFDVRVYVNNTGGVNLTDVWINYTLPDYWTNVSGSLKRFFPGDMEPGEIYWNNITVDTTSNSNIGPNQLDIVTNCTEGMADFEYPVIYIWSNSSIVEVYANDTTPNVGDVVVLRAKLVYDNGTGVPNKLINFTDLNTSWSQTSYTNDSGVAQVYYVAQSPDGIHQFNITYSESPYVHSSYNQSLSVDVNDYPRVNFISSTNPGYGYNSTITVNVTDNDSVDVVSINITLPNGSYHYHEMAPIGSDLYQYNFSNTWVEGRYNFTIRANDTLGAIVQNESFFYVNASFSLNVRTTRDLYYPNQLVNLTDVNLTHWWNYSWVYRLPHNLTANEGYDLTVSLPLNTQELISQGKMNESCKDVRVTYLYKIFELPVNVSNPNDFALQGYPVRINISDHSVLKRISKDGGDLVIHEEKSGDPYSHPGLPYWVEEKSSSEMVVWVKLDLNPKENKTIYLYYGNYSHHGGDGEEVFEFFDDFDGPSLDSSKWTQVGTGAVSFTTEDGRSVIKIDNTNDYAITTNTQFSGNLSVERMVKAFGDLTSVDDAVGITSNKNSYIWPIGAYAYDKYASSPGNNVVGEYHNVSNYYNSITTTASGSQHIQTSWRKHVLKRLGNHVNSSYNGEEISIEPSNVTYSGYLQIYEDSDASGTGVYIDWVFVRKIVENEPSVSVGSSRFIYESEEEVPHHTRNCNSTQTKIDVKVPLLNDENSTVYVYYGNMEAESNDDPESTYAFYDDFSSDTLSNYDQYGETWTVDTLGGVVRDSTSNSDAQLILKDKVFDNVTIITRARSNDDDGVGVVGRFSSTSSYYAGIVKTDTGWSPSYYSYIANDSSRSALVGNSSYIDVGEWHEIKLVLSGTNLSLYVDGALSNYTTDSEHSSGRIGLISSYNSPSAEFDYLIAMRNPVNLTRYNGSEEIVPSHVYNHWYKPFKGYLTIKVQRFDSGWSDVDTILSDSSPREFLNYSSTNLAPLFGNWDTDAHEPGTYRVFVSLGNPHQQYGSAYYNFTVSAGNVNITITKIVIYNVTYNLNPHTYTGDLEDEGLNKTFVLYENQVYRVEVHARNYGTAPWNVSNANITHENLNSSWVIASDDIWYKNETDTSERGPGVFEDGEVRWNSSLGGTVAPNTNITFYYVINLSNVRDTRLVHFVINDTSFVRQDYSTFKVISYDNVPPYLYNGIYGMNDTDAIRGETLLLYGRWNETISEAKAEYNTTSVVLLNHTISLPPSNPYNWTNETMDTSIFSLGTHWAKLYAKDEVGNWNTSLAYIFFNVSGLARVTEGYLSENPINVTNTTTIYCRVVDVTNNTGIQDYVVHFYNSTGEIGTNVTNSTGWAWYDYTDNSPGTEVLSCNITPNLTRFYKTDELSNKTLTLVTNELEEPKWHDPQSNASLVHKGDYVRLSVNWTDNFELDTALLYTNSSGSDEVVSSVSLSGTSQWANFTYLVPDTMKPGYLRWYQRANDTSGNSNQTGNYTLEVWGWAKIGDGYLSNYSIYVGNTTTIYCRVIDVNGTGIQDYVVHFYNSTGEIGTNVTNSTGWAWYDYTDNSEGTETLTCNITDNSSLMYNVTQPDNMSFTLNTQTGGDITPPKALVYGLNDTSVLRGECLKIYAQWDEEINTSYVRYNSTSSTVNEYYVNPPYAENWTNYTIVTYPNWTLGIHYAKLRANDTNGNWNNSLEYKTFEVRGRAGVFWVSPEQADRGIIPLVCNVTDMDTGEGIANYKVDFYNSTYLGYNYTNSSGMAVFYWDASSMGVGPQTITCSISDDDSKYYQATQDSVQHTVYLYGHLNTTILSPENQTIVHRGEVIWLNSTTSDERGEEVTPDNVSWYNSTTKIAVGENVTWNIPVTHELGPETITVNSSKQYYHNSTDHTEVIVYGYSNASQMWPSGTFNQGVNITLICYVVDANTSSGISDYPVQFWVENSTGTFYLGTNYTQDGNASYVWDTSSYSSGTYYPKCNITDNSTLYYNVSKAEANTTITLVSFSHLLLNITQPIPPVSYDPNQEFNYSVTLNCSGPSSCNGTMEQYYYNDTTAGADCSSGSCELMNDTCDGKYFRVSQCYAGDYLTCNSDGTLFYDIPPDTLTNYTLTLQVCPGAPPQEYELHSYANATQSFSNETFIQDLSINVFIDITVELLSIDWGYLGPGESNVSAEQKITVENTTNVLVDIYLRGTDLTNDEGNVILVGNITYDDDPNFNEATETGRSEERLTSSYAPGPNQGYFENLARGTTVSLWYNLTIPLGQPPGDYLNSIYIKAVQDGTAP